MKEGSFGARHLLELALTLSQNLGDRSAMKKDSVFNQTFLRLPRILSEKASHLSLFLAL